MIEVRGVRSSCDTEAKNSVLRALDLELTGDRWPLRSLVVVFWLQGALMWVVSLPVPVAMTEPTPPGLGALDFAGAALWAAGLAFEAVGDHADVPICPGDAEHTFGCRERG